MTSISFTPLPSVPAFHSSFRTHRSEIVSPRLGPTVSVSKSNRLPNWASLPSPPMSGSPPPDERIEPQQLAGTRRKRSETPPTTTAAGAALEPVLAQALPEQPIQRRSAYLGLVQGQEGFRPGASPYAASYATSQPLGYGGNVQTGAGSSTAPQLHFGPGQISPRATRKTKAHVASACVNCKKKHLRCDHARPCNRCIATGKEGSCFDVEHKKRGRPPLKPEDAASRRSLETASSPLPASSTNPGRRGTLTAHGLPPTGLSPYSQPPPSYQRDIRPIQTSGLGDYGGSMLRPGPRPQSMYAAPTVSPSPANALGTVIQTGRGFSSEVSSASTQPPTPYFISPPGYSPHGADNTPRSIPPYGSGYAYSQQQPPMMQPSQSPYYQSLFPRGPAHPHMSQDPPIGMYGTGSLQLPPIRPAPQGSFEPAMAQQQRQAQQQQYQHQRQVSESPQHSEDGTRQPEAKRPRMDIDRILGPRHD